MSIAAIMRELMAAGLEGEALIAAVARVEAAISADNRAMARALLIAPEVRAAVIARDGFVCTYCGGGVEVPHLDHVMPKSRGGQSSAGNLVVSCKSCNSSKKGRTPHEWRGL